MADAKQNPMKTRTATLLLLFTFPLASIALQAPPPTPAEVAERTRIQHAKLRHLLEALQVIETSFQQRLQRLEDTYGVGDVTKLYQGNDLGTMDGIRTARQRVKAFSAGSDGFAAAYEHYWTDLEALVQTNDLAEPLASELRASFSADQTETIPNNRGWIGAMRADATAVAHLLDIAERHLGHFQWQDDRLVAADKRAAIDLLPAQKAVAEAEREHNETGRAALHSRNHTVKFVQSALLELNQSMPRSDGN